VTLTIKTQDHCNFRDQDPDLCKEDQAWLMVPMESPTILLFRKTLLCNLMRRLDGNRNLERLRMSKAEMASFF
jgi:hypothetical protein